MSICTHRVSASPLDSLARTPYTQDMPNDDRIDFRLPADEKARYVEAAQADRPPLTLSLWLRKLATREAVKVLGPAKSNRR